MINGTAGRGNLRYLAPFIAVCVAYPAVVIVLQHWLAPGDNAFARIYSGSPPYAHVTAELLRSRLAIFWNYRANVLMFLVAAAVPALALRRFDLLLGHLAVLPWTLLQLTALTPSAGTLSLYYAFPLLTVALWPLILLSLPTEAAHERRATARSSFRSPDLRFVLAATALLLLVSTYAFRKEASHDFFLGVTPTLRERQIAVRNWILSAPQNSLADIRATDAVLGLIPERFELANSFYSGQQLEPTQTLLVYRGQTAWWAPLGNADALKWAVHAGYDWHAQLGESNFWILGVNREQASRVLAENGLLASAPELKEKSIWTGYMVPAARALQTSDGWRLAVDSPGTLALRGPFAAALPGNYEVEADILDAAAGPRCETLQKAVTFDWAVTGEPLQSQQEKRRLYQSQSPRPRGVAGARS